MRKIVKQVINQEFLPITVEKLAVGKVLEFDCYIKRYNDFVIIIEAGTLLTDELMSKIKKHKSVYVHQKQLQAYKTYHAKTVHEISLQKDEVNEKFEQLDTLLEACKNLDEKIGTIYALIVDLLRNYFESESHKLPMKQIDKYVNALLDLFEHERYTVEDFLHYMPSFFTDATHSVNVSILAALLGDGLELGRPKLRDLCLAGLLHDVGNIRVDKRILGKEEKLTFEEFEAVQEHVVHGEAIAKENGIHQVHILAGIRSHHEKLDGSGYPDGLSGNAIAQFAQIISICEIFDALTTDSPYRKRYSSFDALKLMKKDMSSKLNIKYVDTLIRRLRA